MCQFTLCFSIPNISFEDIDWGNLFTFCTLNALLLKLKSNLIIWKWNCNLSIEVTGNECNVRLVVIVSRNVYLKWFLRTTELFITKNISRTFTVKTQSSNFKSPLEPISPLSLALEASTQYAINKYFKAVSQ